MRKLACRPLSNLPLPGILAMSLTSLTAQLPVDGRQSQTALAIARGTARYLHALGYCVVSELPLPSGRRADLVALGGDGEIVIVEIKSSVADFRADQKWMDYRLHCDRLFFATIVDVPCKRSSAGRRAYRGRCVRRLDRVRGARTSDSRGDAQDRDAALCACGGAAPAGAGRSARTLCRRNLKILAEHDLFGKPVPTFPDHALRGGDRRVFALRFEPLEPEAQHGKIDGF